MMAKICQKAYYKFTVFVLLKPAAFFNLLISVIVVVLSLLVVLPHNTLILDATILPEKLIV